MGTTLVFLVAAADRIFVGGVGDSRVYRIRDGAIEQLTKDHSVVQALIDAGTITPEEAATNRYRNVLYRYLGTKEGSTGTEPKILDPVPGDRFVLCSDGVTDGIDSDVILEKVADEPDPQRAAEAVVQAALDGGSKDNVTCVVVHVG
jgi:protein phosphatase